MALVSFLPAVRVEIPHEPDNYVEFRKPSSAIVREARRVVESDGRRSFRDFGADIVKVLTEGDDDDKAARRAARLAKLQEYEPDQFDRETLLGGATIDGQEVKGAIVAWSGPAYADADGKLVPASKQAIKDLDEATARWAHQVAVDLMKPPTPEVDKSAPDAAASVA